MNALAQVSISHTPSLQVNNACKDVLRLFYSFFFTFKNVNRFMLSLFRCIIILMFTRSARDLVH